LAGSANEVDDLGLDGLDVAFIPLHGVDMAPNVENGRGMPMPPSIAIIASVTLRLPTKPQAITYALLGDTDVDRFVVNAGDIELG
jgi:hypothetical protein